MKNVFTQPAFDSSEKFLWNEVPEAQEQVVSTTEKTEDPLKQGAEKLNKMIDEQGVEKMEKLLGTYIPNLEQFKNDTEQKIKEGKLNEKPAQLTEETREKRYENATKLLTQEERYAKNADKLKTSEEKYADADTFKTQEEQYADADNFGNRKDRFANSKNSLSKFEDKTVALQNKNVKESQERATTQQTLTDIMNAADASALTMEDLADSITNMKKEQTQGSVQKFKEMKAMIENVFAKYPKNTVIENKAQIVEHEMNGLSQDFAYLQGGDIDQADSV